MKHSVKITIILITMFFIAQIIGIFVAQAYLPTVQIDPETGEEIEVYDLPYGLDPPEDISPGASVVSIMVAIIIAVILMFLLMKFKAEIFLRLWFLLVVILGIALAINGLLMKLPNAPLIALAVAIPLGLIKIFQRNMIAHNLTELLIYPGIASVFIPLLNLWAAVLLLILISLYDMYAVWRAGFMQKMAKYQIKQLKIFSGFFIPYLNKKEKQAIKKASKSKKKPKEVQASVAILGGGDVVFPIFLSGVVLATLGLTQAFMIAIGATIALTALFIFSQKGKFYPAMPFITAGCLLGLGVAYLI